MVRRREVEPSERLATLRDQMAKQPDPAPPPKKPKPEKWQKGTIPAGADRVSHTVNVDLGEQLVVNKRKDVRVTEGEAVDGVAVVEVIRRNVKALEKPLFYRFRVVVEDDEEDE